MKTTVGQIIIRRNGPFYEVTNSVNENTFSLGTLEEVGAFLTGAGMNSAEIEAALVELRERLILILPNRLIS